MSLLWLPPVHETTGSLESLEHIRLIGEETISQPQTDLTEPARKTVRLLSNRDIANDAETILNQVGRRLRQVGVTDELPPLRAFEAEDGSLLLEWIFDDVRIGLSLEPDKQESGWFLVSNMDAGGLQASGFLEGINTERLVSWLVSFLTNVYLPST